MKFPAILAQDYPEHVVNATVYGRLAANDYLVNVIMDLNYNAEVRAVVYVVLLYHGCLCGWGSRCVAAIE